MDNKLADIHVPNESDSRGVQPSASIGYGNVVPSQNGSLNAPTSPATPVDQQLASAPASYKPQTPKRPFDRKKLIFRSVIIILVLLSIGGIIAIAMSLANRKPEDSTSNANRFNTVQIPLNDLILQDDGNLSLLGTRSLVINGPLLANASFSISPSAQPSNANRGQIYYDQSDNQLAYYNGNRFIKLSDQAVQTVGGLNGAVALGEGLTVNNNQITNTGVLTLQGQTGNVTLVAGDGVTIDGTTISSSGVSSLGGQNGAITLGAGLSLSGNTLRNSGIISAAAGSGITVINDGNGNITISNSGAGSGTVSSPGGTNGRIAKFTGVQSIADSLLSETGTTVTVNGNLAVTGSLTLGTALSVGNGGTGSTALANNGVVIGQGAGALTAVTAGGSGLCLMSTAGAPAFQACPGGGVGVTSLNGLTGALSVANASTAGSTITIDDASTTQKGIAQFNSTNFTASGGTVNTIQNINSAATPTFAGVNTNSINPSAALTVGATGQQFTLQGNASSVINATSGVNATTLAFQSPTANVTYRFATAAAGTYDVCTTVGNCAGTGGGVTTAGGTNGTLAVFTGAQTLGDSLLSQSGGTVTVNGNLNLTTGNQFQVNGSQISSANLSNDANLAKLNASQTFTGATNTFQNAADSPLAFSIQNASNNRLFSINTTAGTAVLGQGSTVGGQLVFSNATNNNTITVIAAAPAASHTYTLPDVGADASFCLSTGNCAGAAATLQSAYNNSTSPEITVDATRGALTIRDASTPIAANLLEVQDNAGSTTYLAVTASGVSVTGTATTTGNINTSGGALQTNGTNRVDNTGNLVNIANLTLSGAISGGTTISGSGNFNTTGGALQTNSVTRVDNSGNLTNIGNITGTGAVTIASSGAGNDITINGADQFIVQDASTFNALTTFTTDVDMTLADTENLEITNTVTGTNDLTLVYNGIVNNTTSGTQRGQLIQNIGGTGTTEALLILDNADADTVVTAGLVLTSAAGGMTTAIDVSDPEITTALLFGDNDITGTNFTVTGASGNISSAGNATLQGGVVTVGTTSQAGTLVLNDGSSNTGTLQLAALGQNTIYTLPDPGGDAEICLNTGNCAGSGGGVTGSGTNNRLVKFTSTGSTVGNSTITDDGTAVTTTVDVVVQGGDITVGGSSQLASLILHDGNGQTTTLQAGDSGSNLTFILPTVVGSANQCLKQSGTGNQLVWADCDGGAGGSSATLQSAYNNGNTITTTDASNINFVLADTATDANFAISVADGSTSFVSLSRANGTGTADPAQLLLLDNLDADRAVPVGLKLQAAGGGMTTAIDATDAEIVDAISVGANNIVGTTGNIDFTNFDVVGASGDTTIGGTLAVANTTNLNGSVTVGDANTDTVTFNSVIQGQDPFVFEGATADANELTLRIGSLTGDRTVTLGDEGGTVCLQGSINCGFAATTGGSGYIQNQNGADQTADFRISGTGQINTALISPAWRPPSNSTTALSIQNAAGSATVLSVDTTNSRVGIGGSFPPEESLDVIGNLMVKNAISDTKSLRMRTNGTGVDLEGAASELIISVWQDAAYSTTQYHYLTLEHTAHVAQATGSWQFRTVDKATTRHTIDGTTGTNVAFNQNGEATDFTVQGDTDANLVFVQGSTDRVGIGTNTPGYKLDVAGDINTSANVRTGGTIRVDNTGAWTNVASITGTTGDINFTNFDVTGATGNITTAGDVAVNGGDVTSTGSLTLSSAGAGNDIILNSNDTIELQDNTNVTGALATTGIVTVGTLGTTNTSTALCLNASNQIAGCSGGGGGTPFIQGGNSFSATAVLGTNDANALEFETGGVTRMTIAANGSSVTLATNTDLLLQGATAYISNGQGQTGSESFGLNATVGNSDQTVIGNGANGGSGTGTVAIGANASTTSTAAIAIGASASSSFLGVAVGGSASSEQQGVAIGESAVTSGHDSIAIGYGATTGGSALSSIALGQGATTTASNQLVIGADVVDGDAAHISDVYIGSGVTDTTPTGFTLQGTGGSGSNVAGATVNIASGRGTGTAAGGNLNLQVSSIGTTGSTLNPLATVASFSGANGSATFKNTVDSTSAFNVQTAASASVFNVDTTNSRVSVGSLGTPTGQLYVGGKLPTAAVSSVSTGIDNTYAAAVQGKYLYAAVYGKLRIYDISRSTNPAFVGSVGVTTGVNNLVVSGHYVYLWANTTISIVDVSNPSSPTVAKTISVSGMGSLTVAGRYMYVTTSDGSNTFRIYDITNPAYPTQVGSLAMTYSSGQVVVSGQYAYIAAFPKLEVVDISNPASPTQVTNTYSITGSYPVIQGRVLYTVDGFTNVMQATDISNPASPTQISTVSVASGASGIEVQGHYAYLPLDNTGNGIQVIDITNPASMSSIGTVSTGSNAIRGLAVDGRYVYAMNYGATTIDTFDFGGAYLQQLEVGGIEAGTINIDQTLTVGGTIDLGGSLSVGRSASIGGALGVNGALSVHGASNTTSAFTVLNSAGDELVNVDSTNSIVRLLANNTSSINSWTTNANEFISNDGRYNHGTIVANGYIYVIGGYDEAADTPQTTVEYAKLNADGSIGTWGTTTALPQARAEAATVFSNGYVYVIGGRNAATTVQTSVYYAKVKGDGTLGPWNTTTILPSERTDLGGAAANGYLYAVGGRDSGGLDNDTVYYAKTNADGTIGAWSTTNTLPGGGRRAHSVIVANGYLYSVGGIVSGGGSAQVAYAQLNASNGTVAAWATTNSLPDTRYHGALAVLNGYMYHFGGEASDNTVVYRAQLNAAGTTGTWTSTTHMTNPRRSLTAASANGYLYVLGGEVFAVYANQEYASPTRVSIGASLDLVGLSGEDLSGAGGAGGNLTAGNTLIAGSLSVIGGSTFKDGVSVNNTLSVSGTASVQTATDSTSGFRVLNSTGGELVNVDTVSSLMRLLGNNTGHIGSFTADSDTLPAIRAEGGQTHLNGYLYYLGGCDSGGARTSNAYYNKLNADGSLSAWQSTTSLPFANCAASATSYNGYVYVHGGAATSTDNATLLYGKQNADGTISEWKRASVFMNDDITTTIVAYNGFLYETNMNNASIYYHKINADGSIQEGDCGCNWFSSETHRTAGVAIANGYIYAVGGAAAANNKVYYGKINPDGSVTNPGTTTSTLPAVRDLLGVTVANGYIYALGGEDASSQSQTTVYYAPLNSDGSVGTWQVDTTTLPGERSDFTLMSVNNHMYIIGGWDDTPTRFDTSWYNTLSRVQIGGGLDLIGLTGESLADGGSGGTLTAGNTHIAGTLNVTSHTTLRDGLAVMGDLSAQGFSSLIGGNSSELGSFVANANTITARSGILHSTVTLNGYVYVLGGCNTSNAVTNTVQYAKLNADGQVGTWNTTTTLPASSCDSAATVYNGMIFVAGGTGAAGTGDDIYMARPNNDGTITSWTTLSTVMPDDLEDFGMFAYSGYLYVVGGQDTANAVVAHSNDVSRARINADGSLGAFTTQTDWIPANRMGFGLTVANGYVYILGGKATNAGSGTNTAYYGKINADGSLAAAVTDSTLPLSLRAVNATTLNGNLYLLGGNTSGTNYADDVFYARLNANGDIDAWTQNPKYLPDLQGAGGVVTANGYVYYIGGSNATDEQNDVWFASGSRIKIGGSLDLVGMGGEELSNGGTGGELTAGNTRVAGTLNVLDNAIFRDSVSVLRDVSVAGDLSAGSFSGAGLTDCDASGSKVLWDATTRQFSCGTDRASVTIKKASDESVTSSTAMQADNELTFPIGANDTYIFEININATFSAGAGGTGGRIKYEVVAPTGATCNYSSHGMDSTGGASEVTNGACGTDGVFLGNDTFEFIQVSGTVTTGATAGNVTLQWAQNTSSGTATVVKAGSNLTAYKVNGADLAEAYYTKDNSMTAGDIVQIDGSLKAGVKKTDKTYDGRTIGVVSTKPGLVLGDDTAAGKPVLLALAGRIPVKVNAENGAIKAGDYITTSSTPGVGMKATKAGQVIGKAMEDFSGTGQGTIMVFANLSYYAGDPSALQSADSSLLSQDGTTNPSLAASSPANLAQAVVDIQGTVKDQQEKLDDLQNRVASLEAAMGMQSGELQVLKAKDATISGSLTVAGKSQFADVAVAGDLEVGILKLNGVDKSTPNATKSASLDAGTGLLKLQPLGLGGIDLLNGKVVFDTAGNMTIAGTLTAKKVNIDASDAASASVGGAVMKAGETSVTIKTTAVTENSKIFVTPKTKTSAPLAATIRKAGESFTVEIDAAIGKDIAFDWWLTN